jgi:hypothetical protein
MMGDKSTDMSQQNTGLFLMATGLKETVAWYYFRHLIPPRRAYIEDLMGQCPEIFCFCFFMNQFPRSPRVFH